MSFAKNTYVYLFSNILNAAIPFILLPIMTRYLSPGEYGQIAMFQTMLTGIGAFIGLNTVGAATRKFYDDNLSPNEARIFNGSCIQILIFTLFIAVLVTIIAEGYLAHFLSIPSGWLYIALLVSSCTFLINLRLGQWQVRSLSKKYGVLQVGNSALNMFLTLAFIVFYSDGAQARIDALLYAGVISATVAILLLYREQLVSLRTINKPFIKEALNFGTPLVPHVFGAFLLTTADRFIINDELGLKDAGIYMVAVQVSMALTIIFDAINKAYVPWLFEKLKSNDDVDKLFIVRNTYIFFICMLLLAVLPFIIGPFLIGVIVAEEYSAARNVIGLLCLGQIFGGMYLVVTNYLFYKKKTGRLSLVTISCGFLNLSLVVLLISDFGIQGVAFAFALSKFVQFSLTWILSANCVSMPWLKIFKN